MQPAPAGSLLEYLKQIPDPRGRQGRRHVLEAMLAAIVCGVLSGARGYSAIAQWLHLQSVETWHALGFTRKPPTRNAFRDLLMALSPVLFEQAVRRWVETCLPAMKTEGPLRAVAIDGKTLCGTLQPHQNAIHLLSLFDHDTGYVLSQQQVDVKTNEAKAALELLKTVPLQGRVVTGDAMFCQREICQQIRSDGGHYFLIVKDNQPTLAQDIAAEFKAAFSPYH